MNTTKQIIIEDIEYISYCIESDSKFLATSNLGLERIDTILENLKTLFNSTLEIVGEKENPNSESFYSIQDTKSDERLIEIKRIRDLANTQLIEIENKSKTK